MNAVPCLPCCSEPIITEVPGSAGLTGPQGATGATGSQGEPGETPELLSYTDYESPNYTVTTSSLQITGLSVTLGLAGRYKIEARATFKAAAATFAASREVTTYVRNVTAGAAVGNTTKVINTPVITTATETLPHFAANVIVAIAVDSTVLQIFTIIDTGPTAGSLVVTEAEIVAIRLGD